jgi:CARDB protein
VVVNVPAQVGAPNILYTQLTSLNIPLDGTAVVQITVQSLNGFNLPVQLWVTGAGSYAYPQYPLYLAPLPAGLVSADCGPTTAGKLVPPGASVTCSITYASSAAGRLSGLLTPHAFAAFPVGNPIASTERNIPVCALGPQVPVGCGVGIQGLPPSVVTQRVQPGGVTLATSSVSFAPQMPKEGDTVLIRAKLVNATNSDAPAVNVSLMINGQSVATRSVDVPAGNSQAVEFEWKAVYDPRLKASIQVASADATSQTVEVSNLFVEHATAAALSQGRQTLEVRNGECAGFRFLSGVASFCGGSADLELTPSITADGRIEVQAMATNGGIVDLGPQAASGSTTAPETGYQMRASFESGHLYLVQSQGKYAVVYAGAIRSEIDPRLIIRGRTPASALAGGLEGEESDAMTDRLLDRARISMDMQWAASDGRRLEYHFQSTAGAAVARPGVYRQPRQPAAPASE